MGVTVSMQHLPEGPGGYSPYGYCRPLPPLQEPVASSQKQESGAVRLRQPQRRWQPREQEQIRKGPDSCSPRSWPHPSWAQAVLGLATALS